MAELDYYTQIYLRANRHGGILRSRPLVEASLSWLCPSWPSKKSNDSENHPFTNAAQVIVVAQRFLYFKIVTLSPQRPPFPSTFSFSRQIFLDSKKLRLAIMRSASMSHMAHNKARAVAKSDQFILYAHLICTTSGLFLIVAILS